MIDTYNGIFLKFTTLRERSNISVTDNISGVLKNKYEKDGPKNEYKIRAAKPVLRPNNSDANKKTRKILKISRIKFKINAEATGLILKMDNEAKRAG